MRPAAMIGSLAFALALASVAAGEPLDRWDRARDPGAERREQTLADALALFDQARVTRREGQRKELFRNARSLLEAIDAEHSPDLRLRFALGEAVHRLDDDARTIAILAPVVALAPDHPEAVHAFVSLGVAYARTNRSADEIRAYDSVLSNAGELRVLILGNRAEAKSRIGDFAGAIADYEAAMKLQPNQPGAFWGLALTLDRTGDFGRALVVVKEAHDIDAQSPRRAYLDDDNVFFVPAYEKEWYLALEQAMLGAQADRHLGDRRESWQTAKAHWDTFVARATKDDRWLPLARARSKQCDAAIARLDREIKRAPPPRREGPPPSFLPPR